MGQKELVKLVTQNSELTQEQARVAVSTILDSIKNVVKKEGEVKLPGFGVFKNTIRKKRTGRNPQTGATLEIPEKEVVKFKPYF